MTKKPILTKSKSQWASKLKPNVLRGSPVHMNAAVTARYYSKLDALIRQMTNQTKRELEKLFKDDPAYSEYGQQKTLHSMDEDISSQSRIRLNKIKNSFQQLFNSRAKGLAEQMVEQVDKASATAVHGSLKELSGGLSLKTKFATGPMKTAIKAHVTENVSLIKSIPEQYFQRVEGAVMRSITSGNGLQDLVPAIKKYNGMTINRARLIAEDQTRKIYSNLNFERYDKLGIEEFEWVHSGGSLHPRPIHEALDGMIFRMDNLPVTNEQGERNIPGVEINCFVGSQKVSLSNGCRNIWRYRHTGKIVTLEVEGGELLTSTLNHPILTARGWLAANEIEEGDYLACCHINNAGVVDDESADLITTFEEAFNSFSLMGVRDSFSPSKFNFHGDIPDNNVDAVRIDDNLSFNVKASINQNSVKLGFTLSNIVANSCIPSLDPKVFESRISSSSGKLNPLILCELRHPDFTSTATVSQNDSIVIENSTNDISSAPISLGNRENAFTIAVGQTNNDSISLSSVSRCEGWDLISNISKRGGDLTGTASFGLTKIGKSDSTIQSFLRVVKKTVGVFDGHVYTLESFTGWYKVTSTGVISKNCKCISRPIVRFKGED